MNKLKINNIIMEKKLEEQNIIIEKYINKNNEEKIRKYNKGKLLKKGVFSQTFEFINLDNFHISSGKIFPKSKDDNANTKKNYFITEKNIIKSLHHPNIVKLENFFEDSENSYLLFEFCPYGNLKDLLNKRKKLTELEVKYYLLQIVSALKYLRNNKVIHRNLKLENILISDKMIIKLSDFHLGAKLKSDEERRTKNLGSPNYMAPEIIEKKNGYSYEVDIWALGVIIYCLIIGKAPFDSPNIDEACEKIKIGKYFFPEDSVISDPAKDLIQNLLLLDPNKRLKLDEILSHAFLNLNINIPKTLPEYTLKEPPKFDFIKQYEGDNKYNIIIKTISMLIMKRMKK